MRRQDPAPSVLGPEDELEAALEESGIRRRRQRRGTQHRGFDGTQHRGISIAFGHTDFHHFTARNLAYLHDTLDTAAGAGRFQPVALHLLTDDIDILRKQAGALRRVEMFFLGELAGGLYGVAIGRAFYGESMFSQATDASKIALVHLARYLDLHGFAGIDCQMSTPHLASLGAQEMPRDAFVAALSLWVRQPGAVGRWPADAAKPQLSYEPVGLLDLPPGHRGYGKAEWIELGSSIEQYNDAVEAAQAGAGRLASVEPQGSRMKWGAWKAVTKPVGVQK